MNNLSLKLKELNLIGRNIFNMKKILSLFILLVIIAFQYIPATGTELKPNNINRQATNINMQATNVNLQATNINIQAKGAFLINSTTGKVLYEKNAHKRMYPASTTKILTALIAIEKGNLNELVTVGNEVKLIKSDSSKAGLRPGERIYLRDLIRGLMLPSGNDAGNTIAVYIGRRVKKNKSLSINQSINEFVYLMNTKAGAIGAKESHFVNAHGYHSSNHYTTVRDMALIAKEAMKSKFFRIVVNTSYYKTQKYKTEKASYIHNWKNRNELIDKKSKNYYPYANGIKTGHTSQAGYCLVSSAVKGKVNVITVIMNSTIKGQWSDSKRLLNLGFVK